jgi:hypothetical protein
LFILGGFLLLKLAGSLEIGTSLRVGNEGP